MNNCEQASQSGITYNRYTMQRCEGCPTKPATCSSSRSHESRRTHGLFITHLWGNISDRRFPWTRRSKNPKPLGFPGVSWNLCSLSKHPLRQDIHSITLMAQVKTYNWIYVSYSTSQRSRSHRPWSAPIISSALTRTSLEEECEPAQYRATHLNPWRQFRKIL